MPIIVEVWRLLPQLYSSRGSGKICDNWQQMNTQMLTPVDCYLLGFPVNKTRERP